MHESLRWNPGVVTRYCSGLQGRSRTAMLYSVCSRVALGALLSALLALLAPSVPAVADPPSSLKTRNVVLIVSDGLRWQEIFTGADPTLLNETNGGIWDKEANLRREFWRDDPVDRRRPHFPILCYTVAPPARSCSSHA